MKDQMSDILEKSKVNIRKIFEDSSWWRYVQDDVKIRIIYIIDHIETFGYFFKRSFRSLVNLQHIKRKQTKFNFSLKESGVLFGVALPEEVFQSSINATKVVLELNEWTNPNEADVQCCKVLCDQIDFLEAANLLNKDAPIHSKG